MLRRHFRRMESDGLYRDAVQTLLRARGYRAAKDGSSVTPWTGGTRSADAEILTDLPSLRNRARELNRDDPIGSGLAGTFVRNVIGTGIRPQARSDSPETNRAIEAVFAGRCDGLVPADRLTFAEQQALLFGKVVEDGEVFVKESKRSPGDPLWYEIVEADRVSTPSGTRQSGGHEVIDGVEKDALGVPVAYWIRKRHPGDVSQVGTWDRESYDRVPVDAVCHLKFVGRPGQTRGVPMFHAILQDIRDLDLLLLAALKRSQIAACLAVFIRSASSIEELADVTAQKYGYRLDQDFEPGMIYKLYPEETVETLVPNFPTPELVPFVIMLCRRIGAALGISWQVVLRDFGDSTYSSARTDLLESRQTYTCLQRWFVEKFLNWQWAAVLTDAKLRGEAGLRGVAPEQIRQVQWIADGWRWIDPLKEAQSIKTALQVGLTTLQDEAARLGKDYEALIKQRAREKELLEEAGLWDSFVTALGGSAAGGGAPPRAMPSGDNGDGVTELVEVIDDDNVGDIWQRKARANRWQT